MSNSLIPQPRAVVSAIIEKIENNERKIFVQTRWKPENSPTYLGVLEIPAGGIDGYENVYDAVKREVKEETGLDIVRIIDDESTGPIQNREGDISHAFRPFLCQQMLSSNGGLPWIGFVFRCEASGSPLEKSDEATDLRWITIKQLEDILTTQPDKVFGLQYTTLSYYVAYLQRKPS